MSVIVKRLKSSSMEIYVKGAPEVMGEICDKDSCEYPLSSQVNDLDIHMFTQSRTTTMTSYHIILREGIV